MYNNTIKVENKIISAETLANIFQKMGERLSECNKIYQSEYIKNQQLNFSKRVWTFKDTGSKLYFNVDFYDNTYIKFDNYINFLSIYNTRLDEIKSIEVTYRINYEVKTLGLPSKNISEYLYMNIKEQKMNIEVAINDSESKIKDIYKMVEQMVLAAPIKYDEVVQHSKRILAIVGMAIGFIPAIMITLILLFFPPARNLFVVSYVLYPVLTIVIAYFIGNLCSQVVLGKYYEVILQDRIYAGWNHVNNKKLYKDNIANYINSSEILIGKNVKNLDYRKIIMDDYNKYKKWLLYEICIVLIISIVVLFLK